MKNKSIPDPQSYDKKQKVVQLQGRKSSYYDMQKRTVRSWGYSSRDQYLLILKLMSKR